MAPCLARNLILTRTRRENKEESRYNHAFPRFEKGSGPTPTCRERKIREKGKMALNRTCLPTKVIPKPNMPANKGNAQPSKPAIYACEPWKPANRGTGDADAAGQLPNKECLLLSSTCILFALSYCFTFHALTLACIHVRVPFHVRMHSRSHAFTFAYRFTLASRSPRYFRFRVAGLRLPPALASFVRPPPPEPPAPLPALPDRSTLPPPRLRFPPSSGP